MSSKAILQAVKDAANPVHELTLPCTPSKEIELEELPHLGGPNYLVTINSNGGMAGGVVKVVGTVIERQDIITISLFASKRSIQTSSRWVSKMEPVRLYRQVHIHENPNKPSPQIRYFYAKGHLKLKQSTRRPDSKTTGPLWSIIDQVNC